MYDSFGTAVPRKDEITQIALGRWGGQDDCMVGLDCLLGQSVESEKMEGGIIVNIRGRNHANEGQANRGDVN